MRLDSTRGLVVATTDLLNYLACEQLSVLDLLRAKGKEIPKPVTGQSQLAAKMGLVSEKDVLRLLEDRYGKAIRISGNDRDAFEETQNAMHAGADLIYQGLLLTEAGGFLYESRPDFLVKVERPSQLGNHSYEPVDSKLSKTTKLDDLFQVLDYADAICVVQGVLPRRVHLFLAASEMISYKTDSYIEEIRIQKERFLRHVGTASSVDEVERLFPELDPKPNRQCAVCDWAASCEEYWEQSDSLYRVANITKSQVARLNSAGINSLVQLGGSKLEDIEAGISRDILENLITQARVQSLTISSGSRVPHFELRPDAFRLASSGKGLGLLPRPSEGDIFFDIEGDPFFRPDGLEYLFGIVYKEGGIEEFKAFWGTDPAMEREAFGELIDFFMERFTRYPDLHIYHYADYERNALSKLASRLNYKVFEVDTILRRELLVDLYPAVRGTIFLGADSYSLKKVEKLYLAQGRQEAVTTAMGSVESFEAWLASGDQEILSEIERYNEMDVRSTSQLRDFLLILRGQVSASSGEFPFRGEGVDVPQPAQKSPRELEFERFESALSELALYEGDVSKQRALQLASDLIGFHSREEKPKWWRYFNLISPERNRQDYISESGCLGGLVLVDESVAPNGDATVTFGFDKHQPFRTADEVLLDPDLEYQVTLDPGSGKRLTSFGRIQRIDFAEGLVEIKRNKKFPKDRVPKNLIGWTSVSADQIEKAVLSFADRLLAYGGSDSFEDSGYEILTRNRPRFTYLGNAYYGLRAFSGLFSEDSPADIAELAVRATEHLSESYLVIQGPPGSGKTFLGAKVATELVRQGRKVFITALSHSAVDNFIEAVVPLVANPDQVLRVESAKARRQPGINFIKTAEIASQLHRSEGFVVGGTIWNGSREELAKGFDYGFIDEAGQFSLSDAIALSTSCRNLVLTGDPQQLSQPVMGSHPYGSASSVLEHLVGDRDVVDPDYGLFLSKTFRMHPSLTDVVSAISYDSQLASKQGLERLELLDSNPFPRNGLVYVPVEHQNNTFRSSEEVDVAKKVVEFLLKRSWVDKEGNELSITPEQIMVVAPYNAQTNALAAELAGLASVGTVDKFQGREAPFVIVSLTASDGESSGRGVDFLFSTNRLNVAISRAKVMSIIVGSPALIETKPNTIDQLELLGAVTKVIKAASKIDFRQIP